MTLAPGEARQLQQDFIRGFIRWLGTASQGAVSWEAPGLSAAVVPMAAERSIINSVIADDSAALRDGYEELSRAYLDAGVDAWTVWIHEGDADARSFLEEQGHAFDGAPVAMTLELASRPPEDVGGLDWDSDATFEELGRINDLAYGYEPATGMANALLPPQHDMPIRLYRARVESETACVLGTLDVGRDAGILFVATKPELRGRGLASRLLAVALAEAEQRGMTTSSLQASALGSPIYERLGYSTCFSFHIMERHFRPRSRQ